LNNNLNSERSQEKCEARRFGGRGGKNIQITARGGGNIDGRGQRAKKPVVKNAWGRTANPLHRNNNGGNISGNVDNKKKTGWANLLKKTEAGSQNLPVSLDKKLHIKTEPRIEKGIINGLTIIKDFMTRNEEKALIQCLNKKKWSNDIKRKTQQYGYKFNYQTDELNKIEEGFPDLCKKYAERLESEWLKVIQDNDKEYKFDQIIVNKYPPDGGIKKHVDRIDLFDELFAGLSLGSDTTFVFTCCSNKATATEPYLEKPKIGDEKTILLKRRSMYIIQGDARFYWQHGIPEGSSVKFERKHIKRKERISVTYRKVI